jgi:hypothetical protein
MILTIRETRHSVLLARMYRREHRNTDDSSLPPAQRIKNAVKNFAQKALKRPFLFLATESIVQFAAAYSGYLYVLSYLLNSDNSFVIVFSPGGHGTIGVGLCFLGGTIIGLITNALFQEPYFKRQLTKNEYKNIPEGRVMMGKFAALVFPISVFMFAWTSYKRIHSIVPILASTLWGWGFYSLILMTYNYIEDSYKVSSDSPIPLRSP